MLSKYEFLSFVTIPVVYLLSQFQFGVLSHFDFFSFLHNLSFWVSHNFSFWVSHNFSFCNLSITHSLTHSLKKVIFSQNLKTKQQLLELLRAAKSLDHKYCATEFFLSNYFATHLWRITKNTLTSLLLILSLLLLLSLLSLLSLVFCHTYFFCHNSSQRSIHYFYGVVI